MLQSINLTFFGFSCYNVITKNKGEKKMKKQTQWDVTKYGQLVERTDIEGSDLGCITTKIYKYQDKYYMELWDNGYNVYFSEVIG